MEPEEPKKFGRYEIRGEIGRGGMATVYHAYDPRFEREVALKVLPREMLHDTQFRTRFEREAKTIAMLEHPAIVPVHDFGEEDGQPYFVMRYMTGGSLSDRMKKGPMTIREAAYIISRIAPALDEAHSKGIIHRDLKPGNILFDQFNEPYISDFGIAKLSESTANVTGSSIIGTPAYMSPEQAQGKPIDGRSDIYGLGVILFELLTGQQPYHGDTPMSVVIQQITEPAPHVRDFKTDLPPDIEIVIEKAMAKDRNERFPDVKSLSNALTAVARGERLSLGPSDATRLASAGTTIAAAPSSQPLPGTIIAKRAQVPVVVEPVPAPVAPRSKTGLWIGLGVVAILVVCIVAVIAVVLFRNMVPLLAGSIPTKTPSLFQVLPSPSPRPALIPEPSLGLAGYWLDVETNDVHTIEWQNGQYVVTSTASLADTLTISSQSWLDGILTWTYTVQSSGVSVTFTTLSAGSDSLYTDWSNSNGDSGTETLQRVYSPVPPRPVATQPPATQPPPQASMAGRWNDPETTGTVTTIIAVGRGYSVESVINPNRGGNELTKTNWLNGVLTWTYCIPGGNCITTATVSVSGGSLYTTWTDDRGYSGETTFERLP